MPLLCRPCSKPFTDGGRPVAAWAGTALLFALCLTTVTGTDWSSIVCRCWEWTPCSRCLSRLSAAAWACQQRRGTKCTIWTSCPSAFMPQYTRP